MIIGNYEHRNPQTNEVTLVYAVFRGRDNHDVLIVTPKFEQAQRYAEQLCKRDFQKNRQYEDLRMAWEGDEFNKGAVGDFWHLNYSSLEHRQVKAGIENHDGYVVFKASHEVLERIEHQSDYTIHAVMLHGGWGFVETEQWT